MKRSCIVLIVCVISFMVHSCAYEDTSILLYFTPGEVRVISGELSASAVVHVDPAYGLDGRTVTFSVENQSTAQIHFQTSRSVILTGGNAGQTVLKATVSGISNKAIMTVTVLPSSP